MKPHHDQRMIEECSLQELQALRKSEENLRVTLASIGDAVIATDEKGIVTTINPVAETLTGWKYKDAIGKDLRDVFHIINAKTRKPVPNPISKVLEHGKTVGLANHTILIAKHGTEHQIADSAAPIKDTDGHISGVILVFRDVTREYKAAEARFETLARFSGFAEASQYGMGIADLNGRIVYVNPSLARMLGEPSANDCLGKHFLSAYYSPSIGRKFQEEILPRLMRDGHWHGELELSTVDGRCVPTDENFFIISDEHGKPRYIADLLTDITTHKRADKFLKLILDNIPDYVFWKDRNSVFQGCNKNIARVAGLKSPNDIIGKTDYELGWKKEESDFFVATDRRIMESNQPEYHIIEPQLQKDGSQAWLDTCKVPLHDEQGNVIGILGTYIDITERKQMEEALRKNTELFDRFMFHSPIFTFIKEVTPTQSRVLQASDNFKQMIGRSGQEIRGKLMEELFPPDFAAKMTKDDWAVVSSGKELKLEEDFNGRHYTTIKFPIIQGDKTLLAGYTIDITERKRAEDALRASQQRFKAIVDASPMGMHLYELTSDGHLIFVGANPSADVILGINHARLLGLPIEKAFPGLVNTDIPARYREAALHGTPWRTEQIEYHEGFIKGAFEVTAFQTEPNKMVAMFNEITLRKQAEAREKVLQEKLERSARMESLGVLADGVAHDLNNILGPIIALPDLAIDYMRRHGNPTEPEHTITLDALQMMKSSALRAAGVVSDLVVMGRRGQFKMEPVNMNRIVEQLLDSRQIRSAQASRPDVKISNQLSEDSLWCLGSESKLTRILSNLINNALEAIEGQGDVTIRTHRRVFTKPYQGYELVPAGNYVALKVMDTGCGMDTNTITRIFEPFFSTKSPTERSGSGLGLSVVHGLVKDHAGFLDVRSSPEKGSSFTVFVPATAAGTDALTEPDILHLPKGTERILVIDDEPGQRLLTQMYLTKIGYTSTVVSTGEEAVALFEAAGREGQASPFDLVMTDMIMDGLDGVATCKTILKLYPAQKLVIMSGHVPDGYEPQVKALNAEWLNKPFLPFELARTVRLRLDRP